MGKFQTIMENMIKEAQISGDYNKLRVWCYKQAQLVSYSFSLGKLFHVYLTPIKADLHWYDELMHLTVGKMEDFIKFEVEGVVRVKDDTEIGGPK
jgi:hypothetical protein